MLKQIKIFTVILLISFSICSAVSMAGEIIITCQEHTSRNNPTTVTITSGGKDNYDVSTINYPGRPGKSFYVTSKISDLGKAKIYSNIEYGYTLTVEKDSSKKYLKGKVKFNGIETYDINLICEDMSN